MPIEFKLKERPAGFSTSYAAAGDVFQVSVSELIGPLDSNHLIQRLENFQIMMFGNIEKLPPPSLIDHMLIIIRPDLTATAYVNELSIAAEVKVNKGVKKGEAIYKSDIDDITSIDLGVNVQSDYGVVVIRSLGWKKSLFYDFGPLQAERKNREYDLKQILAKQALLLLGMLPLDDSNGSSQTRESQLENMVNGFKQLNDYLTSKCEDESKYQELFESHPWMFGGQYSLVERHTSLNDENIPDFTAIRAHDKFRDIIEIKQPYLQFFKKGGNFASGFNDSWNQAERYINFAFNQRSYLRDEKGLLFENPKCLLVIGHDFTEDQLKVIREKEALSKSINVLTYNHIQRTASHLLNLMTSASKTEFKQ